MNRKIKVIEGEESLKAQIKWLEEQVQHKEIKEWYKGFITALPLGIIIGLVIAFFKLR